MYTNSGRLYISGLGLAEEMSEPTVSPKGGFMWQWLNLESGQTLFLKRREALLHCDKDPASLTAYTTPSHTDPNDQNLTAFNDILSHSLDGYPLQTTPKQTSGSSKRPIDLKAALAYIEEHRGDDKAIGFALRGVVARGTQGQIAAFTAALIDILRENEDAKGLERPPA